MSLKLRPLDIIFRASSKAAARRLGLRSSRPPVWRGARQGGAGRQRALAPRRRAFRRALGRVRSSACDPIFSVRDDLLSATREDRGSRFVDLQSGRPGVSVVFDNTGGAMTAARRNPQLQPVLHAHDRPPQPAHARERAFTARGARALRTEPQPAGGCPTRGGHRPRSSDGQGAPEPHSGAVRRSPLAVSRDNAAHGRRRLLTLTARAARSSRGRSRTERKSTTWSRRSTLPQSPRRRDARYPRHAEGPPGGGGELPCGGCGRAISAGYPSARRSS